MVLNKQDIMEKFEFLPIKCRTERARLLYSRRKATTDNIHSRDGEKRPLKSKVRMESFTSVILLGFV